MLCVIDVVPVPPGEDGAVVRTHDQAGRVLRTFPVRGTVVYYDPWVALAFRCPALEAPCPRYWRLDDPSEPAKVPGPTVRINRETGAVYSVVLLQLGEVAVEDGKPLHYSGARVVQGVPVCDVSPWDPAAYDPDDRRSHRIEEGTYCSCLADDTLFISMRRSFETGFICRAGQFDFVVDPGGVLVAFAVRQIDPEHRALILAGEWRGLAARR